MRNMVYQNYGLPAFAGGASTDGYAAKVKENKRQEKLAKKQARNAEKAARSEANRQRSQRKMAARAILDREGYTDIALANMKACEGPSCGPQPAIRPKTYNENVAIANRNIRQQERANQRAHAQAPVRSRNVAPAGYGYYRDGNRQMPVPVTPKGYVPKSYLTAVQNGRSPQSIARDSMGVSARVYPARLTPKQAGPWIKNPGYADIPGIDAPRGTPVTYRPPKAIAGPKEEVKKASPKKGQTSSKKKGPSSAPKAKAKPKAPVNKKQDAAKKKGQGPTVQSKNAKSGSKKGTPSKRSCGTKTSQSKKR